MSDFPSKNNSPIDTLLIVVGFLVLLVIIFGLYLIATGLANRDPWSVVYGAAIFAVLGFIRELGKRT